MILQEFIRNYILYREVLKPILGSWKESLVLSYSKESFILSSTLFNLALNKGNTLGGGEELGWDISDEYEAMAPTKTTGTNTITDYKDVLVMISDLFVRQEYFSETALVSKEVVIVLTNSTVNENAVDPGKTSSQTIISDTNFEVLRKSQTRVATTGCESKQINSFLFETHEKREYLGEFSLTHEETPLMYIQKGGGYHDIY